MPAVSYSSPIKPICWLKVSLSLPSKDTSPDCSGLSYTWVSYRSRPRTIPGALNFQQASLKRSGRHWQHWKKPICEMKIERVMQQLEIDAGEFRSLIADYERFADGLPPSPED